MQDVNIEFYRYSLGLGKNPYTYVCIYARALQNLLLDHSRPLKHENVPSSKVKSGWNWARITSESGHDLNFWFCKLATSRASPIGESVDYPFRIWWLHPRALYAFRWPAPSAISRTASSPTAEAVAVLQLIVVFLATCVELGSKWLEHQMKKV